MTRRYVRQLAIRGEEARRARQAEIFAACARAFAVVAWAASFCPSCRRPWRGEADAGPFGPHGLCPLVAGMIAGFERDIYRGAAMADLLLTGLDGRPARFGYWA